MFPESFSCGRAMLSLSFFLSFSFLAFSKWAQNCVKDEETKWENEFARSLNIAPMRNLLSMSDRIEDKSVDRKRFLSATNASHLPKKEVIKRHSPRERSPLFNSCHNYLSSSLWKDARVCSHLFTHWYFMHRGKVRRALRRAVKRVFAFASDIFHLQSASSACAFFASNAM